MVYIASETVEKFKKLFKKVYGVEYSDQEAWEATYNLLGAFDLLLKIDRRLQQQNNEKLWIEKTELTKLQKTRKSSN